MKRWIYPLLGKRTLDIVAAVVALIATMPVLLVAAAAIFVTMGSPVLFRQSRLGLGGRLFVIYKFRTMAASYDRQKAAKVNRPTPLGRLLRQIRLDELPQLINILRGDMSFVGPRPLLPEYQRYYTKRQARRHDALPGLTGLAQIYGGNRLSWRRKFAYDLWYIDHIAFALDFFILWKTFVLFVRSCISPHSDEVGARFDANSRDQRLPIE